jgi:nucleoside-diphosphate-sugar epimerase
MKRRRFLQQAGLAAVGVPALAGAQAAEVAGGENRVLLTSAHSRLAQVLAAGLGDKYRVSLTSPAAIGPTPLPFTESRLDYGEATRSLVRGLAAIVHVAWPLPEASMVERIDGGTRSTYNLLRAAVDEGVQAVVYLSSLDMLTPYDTGFAVDEDWQPRPTAEGGALSAYLGEFTCREFSREGKLRVTVLRLGRVEPAEEAASRPKDRPWVGESDVVQAVSLALEAQLTTSKRRLGPWSVFHISSGEQARFPAARAKRVLGYQSHLKGVQP